MGSEKSKYMEGSYDILSIESNAHNWSVVELNDFLRSVFTPDYGSSGGPMAKVIDNLSEENETDTLAIATYLKHLHFTQSK